jgi:hypothetical protein
MLFKPFSLDFSSKTVRTAGSSKNDVIGDSQNYCCHVILRNWNEPRGLHNRRRFPRPVDDAVDAARKIYFLVAIEIDIFA